MSLKLKVNKYRRIVMRKLTGGIGKDALNNIDKNGTLSINKVLINRPNQRLGNTLLITPLIQEIIEYSPNVKIDLFVKGKVSTIVFENYPQIDQIIELPKKPFKQLIKYLNVWIKIKNKKYDLVINVDKGSSSGRISTSIAQSKFKLFGDEFILDASKEDQFHMAQYPIYQFRKLVELFTKKNVSKNIPSLNIQLTDKEIETGKKILNDLNKNSTKKTIAFFTYATSSKCYSEKWWSDFYKDFYPRYSQDYNLIEILPVENISMLKNKLPSFYSKDIREIAALMNNCEIVIAADSGMMHLSVAAPTKTLGLFKDEIFLKKYKPYGKGNSVVLVGDDNQNGIIDQLDKLLVAN